jgi:hypothetical protein
VPRVERDERIGHVQEREEVPGDRDGVEGERPAGEGELGGGTTTSCEQRPPSSPSTASCEQRPSGRTCG